MFLLYKDMFSSCMTDILVNQNNLILEKEHCNRARRGKKYLEWAFWGGITKGGNSSTCQIQRGEEDKNITIFALLQMSGIEMSFPILTSVSKLCEVYFFKMSCPRVGEKQFIEVVLIKYY